MEPTRHSVRPAVLLSFVGALAIAYRVQLSWLESTPWYRRFAPATAFEWSLLVGTFALAAAASLVAVVVIQRRVNRVVAVLVSAAVAGLVTTWYDSVAGVALGGAIGCFVAWAIVRRAVFVTWAVVRRAVLAGLSVLAAVVTGTASGATVLAFTGNPGDGWHGPLAWSMSALACGAALLLLWHALRGRARRRWSRFASHGVFLFAVVAGQWLSLSVDTLRRVWWLGTDYGLDVKQFRTLVCDERWLYRGFIGVEVFTGGSRVDDRQLATIGGWDELQDLHLKGAQISDSGLAHIGRLTGLYVVSLEDAPITDDGTKHLAGLTRLFWLDLQGTQVTDRTLARLQSLTAVRTLRLDRTQVTGAGLRHLQDSSQLRHLELGATRVRGEGLRCLDSIASLQRLSLADTAVTDDDLALIARFDQLDLSGTEITDRGLEHLARVHWLIVARTQITDEGLRQFAGSQTLFGLDVSDTQVTDAGLAHLRSLPNLHYLQLAGTSVTAEGLVQLECLPKLNVVDVRRTAVTVVDLPLLRKKFPNVTITIDGRRE